jgi:hypothetical protein
MFSRDLIQAISDFQRDAKTPKQKAERGKCLTELAETLPPKFRGCELICYRQIALNKKYLWKLADELILPENISSWTIDLGVAQTLKGGVPPQGEYHGVIFGVLPPKESVVVNLSRLFRDAGFLEACHREAPNITYFHDGMGRWWNKQQEVILEISKISLDDIIALGGFSSSLDEFVKSLYGPKPSQLNYAEFRLLLARARQKLGPEWIYEEAKDRVLAKIRREMPRLRVIKKLQNTLKKSTTRRAR